jgi:mannose-1-phosphate guanylyltransferase
MNIILLSGGSGKRLWPLSNDIRSKQFIKIFKTPDGQYESMAQRMYRGIRTIDTDAKVTVATSKSQASEIHNQLGDDVGISVEPCRRDTFPAIALAVSYLHDVQGVSEDEPVVVCPVDPYVEDDYFEALKSLADLAGKSDGANLTLLGMEPTYPSEKYGYIIPTTTDEVSSVKEFKEKPDEETAKEYLKQGALWNGGIFAFKLSYVLNRAHELIDFTDYDDLFHKYDTLTKISFDYAVVEKEKSINVLRFHGVWKDLGTWNTLTEAMDEKIIGNAEEDDACENTHIINDLDIPVLVMGLKDAVVSASPDGILVSDKHQSSYIKPYVDKIVQPVRYAEKSWGSFQVIDVESESMTIKVTLRPGHRMNYHSHERRDEVWTIISGTGRTIVDGMEQSVKAGDVITMQAGCRHTIIADTELQLIEIQLGKEISVHDKKKYAFPE